MIVMLILRKGKGSDDSMIVLAICASSNILQCGPFGQSLRAACDRKASACYLPEGVNLISSEKINPSKVFDLTLPLAQAAEGYRTLDDRRAIKALLRP
jgi:threonine dehydrogenase-like Zn-dependent dehydrogenase